MGSDADNDIKKCLRLVEYFVKTDKSQSFKEGEIHTYFEAFLYQPALKFGQTHLSTKYKNVLTNPTRASPCLEAFLSPDKKKKWKEDVLSWHAEAYQG